MRLTHSIWILSSSILVACIHAGTSRITLPTGVLHRVTTDYAAIGDAANIQPFIHDEHTMIKIRKDKQQFSKITDDQGNPFSYIEHNGYYVLDNALESFVVSGIGRTVKFVRVMVNPKVTTENQSSLTLSRSLTTPESEATEVKVVQETNKTTVSETKATTQAEVNNANNAIFELMKLQIAKQKELLNLEIEKQGILKKQLADLQAKLNLNETKMESGTAVVNVNFPFGSSVFRPEANMASTLVSAAKEAKQVTLYGRTDSYIADAINKKIARSRAQQVKRYLIKQGVSAEKITTFSQAAGDFIAPPNTSAGKALNRRVTIEMAMQ